MTPPEGIVHRPPFPVGWFAVAALDEIPVGVLMPLAAFGRDLAVGSAPSGRALVTDSVCPHLGADLAAGGRIDDGQVVCPLHEWCFSHAGACVSSGSEPLPAAISLRVWPTEVVGGIVLAFNVETIVPWLELTFNFQIMPGDVYYVTEIPSEVHLIDVIVIPVLAFLVAVIATIYPSRRAAAVAPAEALRYE